jgi:DNA-binding protein H-NS
LPRRRETLYTLLAKTKSGFFMKLSNSHNALFKKNYWKYDFSRATFGERKLLMARSPQAHAKPETTPVEFSSYSFDELLELKKGLDDELQSRKAREIEELRSKVTESAHTLGVSIHELFGLSSQPAKRQTRHARGKQPAKYRGPNGEEWSGRGPAPRWMKPYLTKGQTKADFLIK